MDDSKLINRAVGILRFYSLSISHVHVYGLWPSRRNEIIQHISAALENDKYLVIRLNCTLVEGSPNFLCQELLLQIPDRLSDKAGTLEDLSKNFRNFFELNKFKRSVVIVLRNSENLCRLPSIFLLGFFKLSVKHNGLLKILTSSKLPWSHHEMSERISNPAQFSFAALNKNDLCEFLHKRLSCDKKFIKLTLDTVYATCRDPDRLTYMISQYMSKSPLSKNNENSIVTFKKILPQLRNFSDQLFYRVSDYSENDVQKTPQVNLPYHGHFILIAAFCASNNPSATDRRFFTKNHGKQRRRRALISQRKKLDYSYESGSKVFDIQRLLFIYLSLLDMYGDQKQRICDINISVCELCAMGFLCRTSADGNIDAPKYRCLASFEMIQQLARSCNMVLRDHLSDF